MTDQIRQQVLDAVARGEIPAGSPSHLAAHGLLDELPDGYWRRWNADTADRIRAQAEHPRCCCGRLTEPEGPDQRCERCMGFPT